MSIMSESTHQISPTVLRMWPRNVLAWGQTGSTFTRGAHQPAAVMRAALQKIANRLSHLEQTPADRDVTDAFLAFAEETDDAFVATFAPEIALAGAYQPIGTLLFVVEPECGAAFLARHIAAALAAQNFVAVSVLLQQPGTMSRLLATVEDVIPDSFATVSRDGFEDWRKVPRGSHVAILTPHAVFFEKMPHVTFDDTATDHASRRALIGTYSGLHLD